MKLNRASLKKGLFSFVPANNRLLYRLCKRYVDSYNNENNDDMETNGELHFVKSVLPQCRLVIDIRANVGHWAVLALKTNPQINPHCFEPSYLSAVVGQPVPVQRRLQQSWLEFRRRRSQVAGV